MKSAKNTDLVSRSTLVLATLLLLVGAGTPVAHGRSLYVIGSITNFGNPLPIMAYDIAPDGTLTFQQQQTIPFRDGGAVGIAVDWRSEYLFVTFEFSATMSLLDARTLAEVGKVSAPNAENLAGITVDESKELLYCVDRDTDHLYVYHWDPATGKLTNHAESPITLEGSSAYGIALDEQRGLLYTANGNATVLVYDTADWSLVDTITLDRSAISIAVDPYRELLYTGAGYFTDYTLNQYNLATGQTHAVTVDPDAGVMGLAVDLATGYVYVTTGKSNLPGGDDLLVYDTMLVLIDSVLDIGDPTGIVIPAHDLGYNPLNFRKQIIPAGGLVATDDLYVNAGDTLTYRLCFDNTEAVQDAVIVDALPEHVTFVDADGNGDFGLYDPNAHTFTWSIPSVSAGSSTCLSLQIQINEDAPAGATLRNYATLTTAALPPTTVNADALVQVGVLQPLSLTKEITGGATEPDASGRRYVDVGQEITYRLCFDNRNNDRPADAVSIVDHLPAELTFVRADGDGDFGRYDPDTHTYTWSISSLAPNDALCVEIVGKIREDTAAGTRILNRAVIDSEQTAEAAASITVTVQPLDVTPLGLLKRIAAGTIPGPDDKTLYVGIGDQVTYEICVDSRDNQRRLDELTIVDALPPEVTFVSAEGDGVFGSYDPDKHTYTWIYPSLLPGSGVCLELVVQVGNEVAPGTTIINAVTIDHDDIDLQTTTVGAVAGTAELTPVDLAKTVTAGVVRQDELGTLYVGLGQEVTYTLCATNNTDLALSDVTVVDTLSDAMAFVSATGDGDIGRYDPTTHTYTWSHPVIEPGATVCTDLTVRINENAGAGARITNRARLQTGEIAATADVPVVTEPTQGTLSVPMKLSPLILGREGYSPSDQLTAVFEFPAEITQADIASDPLVLDHGGISANTQTVSTENGKVKLQASFGLLKVLDAIPNDGLTDVQVSGRFSSGRSFVGQGTVLVVAVRPY